MSYKTFIISITAAAFLASSINAGAASDTATPASLQPAPALATSTNAPQAEATIPQAVATPKSQHEIYIRVNAPLFSPLFSSTPLAEVNEDVITIENLTNILGSIHAGMGEGKSAPKRDLRALLNRLVNLKLVVQEARAIGFDKQESVVKAVDDFSTQLLRETLLLQQLKDVKIEDSAVDKVFSERFKEWRFKSLLFDKQDNAKTFEAGLKAGKSFDEQYAAAIAAGWGKEGGKQEEFIPRSIVRPEQYEVLDKMKPGEVTKVLPTEKGFVIYRLEEVRIKDDPAQRLAIRQELDKKARTSALESYKKGLLKKHTDIKKKVYDKLNYDTTLAQFNKYLKDKRVLVEIKGEKPITVAEYTEALQSKFFHGIERAITAKKINFEKDNVLDEMVTSRVFIKEAREKRIEELPEFRTKLNNYTDSILFNEFLTRIVRDEITVTQDELKKFYEEHANEYLSPGGIRLDAIAFSDRANAEKAVERLAAGTDIKWYKEHAEGQVAVGKQYFDLFNGTPQTLASMSDELRKLLTNVSAGEYRVFVDGKTAYALAALEIVKQEPLPYPVVEEAVKERVFFDKLNKGFDAWAEKLKASSTVTIYADFAKQENP